MVELDDDFTDKVRVPLPVDIPMEPLTLRQQHVMIAGGSKGLGKALAMRLVSYGSIADIRSLLHPEILTSN
jgi:hypothetical protein